jgi:hypothetical protein
MALLRTMVLAALALLVLSASFPPVLWASKPLPVHRAFVLPNEPLRTLIAGATGVRVFRLAFYEPGCAGDAAWAEKAVACYSVRREHSVPGEAWRATMARVLGDTRTYSTQFERECSGAPEYVVRLEGGADPVDAWICLECSQITVTVGSKMRARGGFDQARRDLERLMEELLGRSGEAANLPPWALADEEFPLEGSSLPFDEPPALQGMSPGIRIFSSGSAPAPGERRVRVRVDPEGSGLLVRMPAGASPETIEEIDSLVKGLLLTPARRNGLPVSAWIDLAYPASD